MYHRPDERPYHLKAESPQRLLLFLCPRVPRGLVIWLRFPAFWRKWLISLGAGRNELRFSRRQLWRDTALLLDPVLTTNEGLGRHW